MVTLCALLLFYMWFASSTTNTTTNTTTNLTTTNLPPAAILPFSNHHNVAIVRNGRIKDGSLFEYRGPDGLKREIELRMGKNKYVENHGHHSIDYVPYNYSKFGDEEFSGVQVSSKSVLVSDMYITGFQFGHVTNACSQLASWLVETDIKYDLVVILGAKKEMFSTHGLNMVSILELMTNVTVIYGSDWDTGLVIYSHITVVPPSERPFTSALGSRMWKEATVKMFNLDSTVMLAACPLHNTLTILGRHERKRDSRTMVNMPDVLVALQNRFPCAVVKSAFVNSSFTSVDQINIFSSALIISSHSSQLKNLVFSPRNVAFLEVLHMYFFNSFSIGTEEMGLHYRYSVGHNLLANDTSRICTFEEKRFVHCDYNANITILISDVEKLMVEQKVWCPDLWSCL